MEIWEVARLCHELNKAYCETLGDESQVVWKDAPEWQQKSATVGVFFHLESLRKGLPLEPQRSHESWLAEKERDGWKYGPVKDAAKKEHPCFLPFAELPPEQKAKDYLFCGVVEGLFKSGMIQ